MQERLIRVLCNPIRLKLIQCISEKEKTVSELIANCGLSQSAVSQHLSKMKSANLVKDVKEGREVKYSLVDKNIVHLSTTILNYLKEN